jgi:small-conductance mechanosensitive channel
MSRKPATPITRPALLLLCCMAVLLAICSGGVVAETTPGKAADQTDPAAISAALDKLQEQLESGSLNVEQLDNQLVPLARYRGWAQKCIDDKSALLAKVEENLGTLGGAAAGEDDAVARQRTSLTKEKAALDRPLATCRVILSRSNQLTDAVSKRKTALVAEQLLAKGPNVITLLLDNWENPARWISATGDFITDTSGLEDFSTVQRWIFLLLVGAAFAVGSLLRRQLTRLLAYRPPPAARGARFNHALLQSARRYVAMFMATGVAAMIIFFVTRETRPTPFISIVAYGIPLVLLMLAAIDVLLNTDPDARFLGGTTPADDLRSLDHRLKILVVLVFIGYLLFATILQQELPRPAMLLARAVYGAVVLINLAWIVWLLGQVRSGSKLVMFRLVIATLFIAVLAAELLGYRNLSAYVFRILLGTWLAIGAYSLVSNMIYTQVDRLDSGQSGWQQRLRGLLGLKPDQHLPGLMWFRFLLTIGMWSVLFMVLTRVWQVPEALLEDLANTVKNGFRIGTFEVEPLKLLQGILLLVVLLALNSWFRKWLEHEWLQRSRMERGARESIAAISSYLGVGIALIIALGAAGMDFSKLAIIAGALSVGIGFGLQNIVNNFISGLILLFERPVKTGDWVVVGGIEGYVKRISIRTTQIQTFDRADVIVPNSELISNSMTNWMLRDMTGRVRVPVGVAYGSDTARVKDILLDIANSVDDVIKDGFTAPTPTVLFREFGDSSLNFELRCFIRNVDNRLRVISEINFAIDDAFRANGIVIPFPQRDLHVMDWPPSPDQPGQPPPGQIPPATDAE